MGLRIVWKRQSTETALLARGQLFHRLGLRDRGVGCTGTDNVERRCVDLVETNNAHHISSVLKYSTYCQVKTE